MLKIISGDELNALIEDYGKILDAMPLDEFRKHHEEGMKEIKELWDSFCYPSPGMPYDECGRIQRPAPSTNSFMGGFDAEDLKDFKKGACNF